MQRIHALRAHIEKNKERIVRLQDELGHAENPHERSRISGLMEGAQEAIAILEAEVDGEVEEVVHLRNIDLQYEESMREQHKEQGTILPEA